MRIGTPTVSRARIGLHFFRWGWHLKLRSGTRFRHVIFKIRKVSRYGGVSGRELWLGWWMSENGVRKPFNGMTLGLRIERFHHVTINEKMKNPVYPTSPRNPRREQA